MPLFAATIFLSAFLLFLVQPLIGKYILPWFGGSPAVWTTCMLFFQAVLLAGYALAHLIDRIARPRAQAVAYLVSSLAALLFLPIIPASDWQPMDAGDPTARILMLLAATLGLPYLVLASTGPLMQAWFVQLHPTHSPYRLYSLSNLASFLALIAYPLVVEPNLSRPQQATLWSIGFGGYIVLGFIAAATLWRRNPTPVAKPASGGNTRAGKQSSAIDKLLWLMLPACGTILLLAVTNELTQDVAVIPFLWVGPLGLYLLSFVLAFAGQRWYPRLLFIALLLLALWLMYLMIVQGPYGRLMHQIPIYCGGLFVGCMICHGELYRLRPNPRELTAYYLFIAAGGALGGVFVAIGAPLLFNAFYELPLGFTLCGLLLAVCTWRDRESMDIPVPNLLPVIVLIAATAFGVAGVRLKPGVGGIGDVTAVLAADRNFYGLLGSYEEAGGGVPYRELRHGRIGHGLQFLDPLKRRWGTGYYSSIGGGGLALKHFRADQPRRIGLVGLGIGTLATYGDNRDLLRFYDINPEVERQAREFFTYLADSKAPIEIVLGDARLSMEREQPQNYDILVLDAFSGDAIPVHLLTREAFELYRRHLNPGGIIAVHISNRHLDLRPVLFGVAEQFDWNAAHIKNDQESSQGIGPSDWMLLCPDEEFLRRPEIAAAAARAPQERDRIVHWTDDRTNLLQLIRWQPE
jgi:hypothetical protein